MGNSQARPRSFLSSAAAPRGTWIKPQVRLKVSQVVAAKGGLVVNYRREFKSEKKTHVSEKYLGKNPMTRTQWRCFQCCKQAEREATREKSKVGGAKMTNAGRKVVVKVDIVDKVRIRKYVCRPSDKCSDQVTDDFGLESEVSLDILVNMVPILPEEYNCITEVEKSIEVDAEEMDLYKPKCYFVLNNGSVDSQMGFP